MFEKSIRQIQHVSTPNGSSGPDSDFMASGDGVEACELSALEVGLGIIAACLPTCRTLFSRIFNTSLGMRYFYSKPRDINVIVTGDNGSHELADDKSKAKSSTSQHSFQSVVEDEERLCGISAPRQK